MFKQFGGRATREWIKQYEKSPNWKNGSFRNLEPTPLSGNLFDLPKIIYKQLTFNNEKEPKKALPVIQFDKTQFLSKSENSKFIRYAHSAILMRIEEQTILIDPMLGPDTTPIAPTVSKRFSNNTLELIDLFPEIDLMLITHDHYDHLDYASIQKLKRKTKKYFVAFGVKRHLVSWGVSADLIVEFDWWDEKKLGKINITFTPTRHFSGRGLTDRLKTLWGGWAFKTSKENIWFSGDGGYGNHFTEVGKRLGPFEFAFMECGQYNDDWHPIHLFPDEAIMAAKDANVKKAMPVHWAGFALSYQHTWKDPADEFVMEAQKENLNYILPQIGQMFEISSNCQDKWWENL